jgi:small subunit ribosomal protein S17
MMADEEKTENQEQPEEATEEEPQAEEAPAEEQEAEEAPAEEQEAEEAPAEEPAADQPAADPDAPADEQSEEDAPAEEPPAQDAPAEERAGGDDEDAGPPSPKQLRKQRRSQFTGPAKPPRGPEERAGERAEARGRSAAERRRYRTASRQRGGEPGAGTPPAERVAGPKKVRTGTVVSTKAAKTITVQIEVTHRHPTYEKVVRRSDTLHAHDEAEQAQQGDVVRVVETRPLSRTKRWRLVEVLERAR